VNGFQGLRGDGVTVRCWHSIGTLALDGSQPDLGTFIFGVRNMIEPNIVRAFYRVLLKREPENERVVMEKTHAPNIEALLLSFVNCLEIRTKLADATVSYSSAIFEMPPRRVDYDISAEQLRACFDRVRREWALLGEQEPYWSVAAQDRFRVANLDDKAMNKFFETGRATAVQLQNCLSRTGRKLAKGLCLEFGCGTGRVTRYLAELFDHVIGIDVSPGHLKLATKHLQDAGISNVSLKLLGSPEELISILPEFDFLFSTIVFQHNPPPLQKFFLDNFLKKVRPGGGAYFQMPTHTPGYEFQIEKYLNSKPPMHFEMHDLPMHVVFETLNRYDLVPIEVLMDGRTGMLGSHTFFCMKRVVPHSVVAGA